MNRFLKHCIMLLVCSTLFSSAQDIADKTITYVDIRIKGAQTVSKERIRNYMSVKAGQKFSYDKLDDDVRRLYESGLVDDVVFYASPNDRGVKIIAQVKTRPSLQAIAFEGNYVYSDDRLRDTTEMNAGGALNDLAILKGKRAIEKLYRDKGYPDTAVSYYIKKGQNGFSVLVYKIVEGVKGEVDEIYFHGNNAFADVELAREIRTKEKGIFSFLTKSGKIDSATLEEDIQRVTKFYRNNGFLRADVYRVDREPRKNGMIYLHFHVNEGARYTVSGVGFTGMKVFTYDEIWPALSLVKGDSFSAEKLDADVTMIRSYYGSKGYADVRVKPELKNTANNGVTINYSITEGGRYRVGRVNIQGNDDTKDHVIRREVPLKPGEWFNSVDLKTTENRLRNLNYFNYANTTASNSARKGYRDVDIQVSEKRTGSLGFGVGFSSIDSIVGYVNLEQTNFDISDPWGFTGGGQRFSTTLRAGSETQDFRISLTEPWFLGRKLSFGGELYYQDRLYLSDEYDQTNIGGSLFIRKPLGNRYYIRGEYRLEQVDVEVESDNFTNGSAFGKEHGDYLRSALKFSYIFDSRDSNITPRRGGKVDLSATYAGGGLGGDVDAYTLHGRGTKHILLPYDLILNLTGDMTVVEATSGDVPVFERTYLGGARNLRGFDYRDVGSVAAGTRDSVTSENLGGQTSVYTSSELTFPMVNTIRGALFTDIGFVNKDAYDFSADDLHADVGFGLRLSLPMGPFALDYAIPVKSGDQADDSGKFQFYLDYKF